jgi:hypothetical protein
LRELAGLPIGRVVGLGHDLAAEHLLARMALVAVLAGVHHAADGDEITRLVALDLAADLHDAADDLMAGNKGIQVPPQSLRAMCRSEWQTPQ